MKVVVVVVAGCVPVWASASAANYPPSVNRPIVEAGPGGHAVALSGFEPTGSAYAMPGGAFGPLVPGAPVVPDALALDATGAVTALDSNDMEIQVFGAPPGGGFVRLGTLGSTFNATQPKLAVDPGGAVAAAWVQADRLRVAVRLPGASFTQPVDAGPAKEVGGVTISAEGVAHALISRPREPTSSSGSRSDAVLVTLRPGAAAPDAIALFGEEGLALARSASGQLLAVTRRYDAASGMRLITQVVDAAGRPGPARFPAGRSGPGFVDVIGAVLEPDGRAVVAWTVPDGGLDPIRVLVAEGNAATGFATPRRLDRDGQLSGARLAANARGDAVIVWSAFGYRPRASLRAAGGTFGSPVIVSSREGSPPTAGVMPDGHAVVGWTEDEGLVSRQVVARVTSAGAGRSQVLAERSVALHPRERATCRAARRSVISRNTFAVYRQTGRARRREICSLVTGYTQPVEDRRFGDFLDSVRLAGRFVATATVTGEDVGPDQYAEATVSVEDTRTGRSPGPLGRGLGEAVAIGDLVLAADGAYAVTVCMTGVNLYEVSRPTMLARRRCARPGHRVNVIVVDGLGPEGQRVVGRGRTIDPRSLRLRGRRITWHEGARTRAATLRPVRLPG